MHRTAPPRIATLEAALFAVSRAALVCRHVQAQLDAVRAITKDDKSPVTIADFASQAVIARALGEEFGRADVSLIAEESADFLRHADHGVHLRATLQALDESGAWPRPDSREVLAAIDLGAGDPAALASDKGGWTLDPIDGTKGFLRGDQYAVCLAFISRGRPTLGVLACPNLLPEPFSPGGMVAASFGAAAMQQRGDTSSLAIAHGRGTLLWASRGVGAWQRPLDHPDAAPARVRREAGQPADARAARLAESLESSDRKKDLSAKIMAMLAAPAEPRPALRLDSQTKYAVVARSQADIYLRMPSGPGRDGSPPYVERIWDHAAGSLIAQEAGCTVTDFLGKDLDFAHGRGLETNRGVIVAPPHLHQRILDASAHLDIH